ncbi:MAG TPA: tRNA lysidine(34) synthetase TilS [Candidatus Saccharimonadales bacterium]|nr:tRNA lysidine(34) synthetase TilS [Candidatus Saccharimonadales bacterium]
MEVSLEPGRYVVAVSGGVDSVSLLHALRALPDVDLVVAHFDHGIRSESAEDRAFVQALAARYGLPFVYDEGRLGPDAGEAAARQARYAFLHAARRAAAAQAVVTAHHQDDALETAVINLLRGSGRKGLSALGSQPDVARPLLVVPKSAIIDYARRQGLAWREDRTNRDQTYLRNYVRHQLLARFSDQDRRELWAIISSARDRNREIDDLLAQQLTLQSRAGCLDRQWFNGLPHAAAREALAAWLRANGTRDFDSQALERLVVAAKTGRPGSRYDVSRGRGLAIGHDYLALVQPER